MLPPRPGSVVMLWPDPQAVAVAKQSIATIIEFVVMALPSLVAIEGMPTPGVTPACPAKSQHMRDAAHVTVGARVQMPTDNQSGKSEKYRGLPIHNFGTPSFSYNVQCDRR
jgi:hypothetical protein